MTAPRSPQPSTPNPQRILVLGAGGFMGGHILRTFQDQPGLQVIPAGRHAHGADWLELNLVTLGADGVAKALERVRPNVIVNAAGAVTGGGAQLVTANTLTVANLLEAMRLAAPKARLVQIGSAAEYGLTAPNVPVSERDPARPVTPYGVSKLAATELVGCAVRTGLPAVVLRVFNVIGAGLPAASMPGVAARKLLEAVHERRNVIEMGPLGSWRDFMDARDVARAVVEVSLHPLAEGILNVGSGQSTQARRVVALLAEIAGFRGQVLETAPGSPRSLDVQWQQANVGAVTSLLGWSPRFGLRESLEALWDSAVEDGGKRKEERGK